MAKLTHHRVLAAALCAILIGCAGRPAAVGGAAVPQTEPTPVAEPLPEPAVAPEPSTVIEPEPAAAPDLEIVPEPVVVEPIEEVPLVDEEVLPVAEAVTEPAEDFDPASISDEVYVSTKSDVQELIVQLNGIIRAKRYEEWVSYLGDAYREALSDPAFLARVSDSAILVKQKIVLRNLHDYFISVVVPSRANDRVDDIEFIGQNRVKAFTINNKGMRLRLYDLEKTVDGWKIVN